MPSPASSAPKTRLNLFKFSPIRFFLENNLKRRLAPYQPYALVEQENSRYIVRIARDGEELVQAMRLRHEVFFEEGGLPWNPLSLDFDNFDFLCDHLVILEKATGRMVGTYRLNASCRNSVFYSSSEFHLENIARLPGNKLELGRSCVHKDFRSALIIAMLWRGLTAYMKALDIRYLFGCTSLMTLDPEKVAAVNAFLLSGHSAPAEQSVRPRHPFKHLAKYMRFLETLPEELRPKGETLVPPLLKSYLRAGAKVCGNPCMDGAFKCADFFTLFDVQSISGSYEKKFMAA
jgi:putative hemolysin